jgi:hypothetical protein
VLDPSDDADTLPMMLVETVGGGHHARVVLTSFPERER